MNSINGLVSPAPAKTSQTQQKRSVMMGRVVHFEVHAEHPERLIPFYSELLGWHFQKFGTADYWLITTGSKEDRGIDGGLLPRKGPKPVEGQAVNAFVCTVVVEDLDETLSKNAELGGSVGVDKHQIPGVGWLAYIKDFDGNIMGLMQPE